MRKGFVVKVKVNRKDKSQRYNEGISMFSTLCLRTEREREGKTQRCFQRFMPGT